MNQALNDLYDRLVMESKQRLIKDGFQTPLAFMMERNKSNGKFNVGIVPLNFDDSNAKKKTFELLSDELKTGKYQGYVMITEGWVVMVDKTKNTPKEVETITKIPPSKNPNRKECVFVRIQDEFGEMKSTMYVFEKDEKLISTENPKGIKIIQTQTDMGVEKESGIIKDIWR